MTTGRRARTQRTARLGGVELPLGSSLLDDVADAEQAAYLARRAQLAPPPPKAERSSTAETPWQNSILAVVRELGGYAYHPKLSRWSERGWPDLSVLMRRALFIECKADDGQLSESQVRVIDKMLAVGLEVHVLRPWHGIQAVADILTAPGPVPMAASYRDLWLRP